MKAEAERERLESIEREREGHRRLLRRATVAVLLLFAIGTAGAALTGQYLGARNPEMAAKAVRVCWRYAAVFMGLLGVAFLLWPSVLVRLIVPGAGEDAKLLVGIAAPLVFLCGVNQPILATALVLKSSLRGAGATRLVMVYSFATMIFFRGIMVPVAVKFFDVGIFGIWVIMFTDVAVQAVVFSWVHFRGKWVRTEV